MVLRTRRSKGCGLCRAKKVKCDESQPSCLRCQKAGKVCPGAIQGSIFIAAGPVAQIERRVRDKRMSESTCGPAPQPAFDPTRHSWDVSSSKPCGHTAQDSKESNDETIQGDTFSMPRSPGNERSDPFTSLARRTTAREDYFIDFYVHDLLVMFGGSLNSELHPPRDSCFGVNVTGIASMEIMFAFTARSLAMQQGHLHGHLQGHLEAEAKQYNVRAIQRINEAIANPSQRFTSPTIMAVMGCLHDLYQMRGKHLLPEETGEIKSHVEGLRYLIKGRGGFPIACKDSSICWMLISTDLLSHGRISAGGTPLSQHGVSLSGVCSSDPGLLVAEYVGTFRDFSLEAQTRKQKCVSNCPEDIEYAWVSRVFQRGSTFHCLLTSLKSIGVPRICVLFICNIILWDYRKDLRSLHEEYIKRVLISLDRQQMLLSGSMDLLLWTLITNQETHQIDNPQMLWFLARLIRIHEQLSEQLQQRLEDALLQFLELGGELEGEGFQPSFDSEEFSLAIWSDLESSRHQH